MSLGELEQMVLLAMLQLGEGAYGVSIFEEIEKRTGRSVSLGAIYKTLSRLETKGFVASRLGEPTARRGGRRKRLYRVRAPGRGAVAEAVSALRKLSEGLESPLGAQR